MEPKTDHYLIKNVAAIFLGMASGRSLANACFPKKQDELLQEINQREAQKEQGR